MSDNRLYPTIDVFTTTPFIKDLKRLIWMLKDLVTKIFELSGIIMEEHILKMNTDELVSFYCSPVVAQAMIWSDTDSDVLLTKNRKIFIPFDKDKLGQVIDEYMECIAEEREQNLKIQKTWFGFDNSSGETIFKFNEMYFELIDVMERIGDLIFSKIIILLR